MGYYTILYYTIPRASRTATHSACCPAPRRVRGAPFILSLLSLLFYCYQYGYLFPCVIYDCLCIISPLCLCMTSVIIIIAYLICVAFMFRARRAPVVGLRLSRLYVLFVYYGYKLLYVVICYVVRLRLSTCLLLYVYIVCSALCPM